MADKNSSEKLCFSEEKRRICESKIHGQSCAQIGSSFRTHRSSSSSFDSKGRVLEPAEPVLRNEKRRVPEPAKLILRNEKRRVPKLQRRTAKPPGAAG